MSAIALPAGQSGEQLPRVAALLAAHYAFGAVDKQSSSSMRPIDASERAALEAVRGGNGDAYSYLVQKYMRKAMSIAWGVVRREQDAEDIVQEAFVRAYQKIDRMRSDESFGPWLFRIVSNLAIDHVRKRKRDAEEKIDEYFASPMRTDATSTETLAHRIDAALETLPEMQKLVARLYLVEEFSHSEIASIAGVSEGTVRSHLHHARRKLQELLADEYEEKR